MWVSMDNFNIRTTLNHKGIGTSFNHFDGSTYFVSTIESPFVSNEFETIIKISHKTLSKINNIISHNSRDAVINHIAVTRMAISNEISQWSEEIAVDFVPLKLIELMDAEGLHKDEASLSSDYCEGLLRMSGLNYDVSNQPTLKVSPSNTNRYNIFLFFIVLIVAVYHLINHKSLKEFLLSIFTLVFAVIAQNLIFGSKFEYPSLIKGIKGDELLWKVFYLLNLLVEFSLLATFANFSITNNVIIAAFWISALAYKIFITICIWRCAFNTDSKFWGNAARAYAVMEIIAVLGILTLIIIPMFH